MWRRERPAPTPESRAEVPDRWRARVLACDDLLGELTRLVDAAPPGPLQDRLDGIRAGVSASIDDAAAATLRAAEVERLALTMDVTAITASYKAARRKADALAARGEVPEALAESVASLARQHGSAHRLLNAADETDGRLDAVRARLTEIVLSTGELVLGGSAADVDAAEAQAAALAGDVRLLGEAYGELS